MTLVRGMLWFASDMSSTGQHATTLPAVFISYASEDRLAARALRDALAQAGLDVWYDENELGGGDAWDRKIRRQIRDCTYFMPVISATTERRREGYFRREWRLAVERTLDMADDVTFLLPVAIDDTPEDQARVPEAFVSVHWLRCPGGQPTPALQALCARLLAGENALPPEPPAATRAPASRVSTSSRRNERAADPPIGAARTADDRPPPMPPFPERPGKDGHLLKHVAEVLWWGLTAVWIVFKRLPRWLRILLSLWLAFLLINSCDRESPGPTSTRKPSKPSSEVPTATGRTEASQALEQVARELEKAAEDRSSPALARGFADAGAKLVRKLAETDANAPGGRVLAVAPFHSRIPDDPATAAFATSVFNHVFGQTAVAVGKPIGLYADVSSDASDGLILDRARADGHRYLLLAHAESTDAGPAIAARLFQVSDASVAWSGHYPVTGAEPQGIAKQIVDGLLTALPKE